MHQTRFVSGIERGRDLGHHLDRLLRRQRFPSGQNLREACALDQPHVEVQPAVDLPEVVDGNDVRLGQPCCALTLLKKPLDKAIVRGKFGTQPLERHNPFPARVVGPVDLAHAPPTNQLVKLVGAERVRHHAGSRTR